MRVSTSLLLAGLLAVCQLAQPAQATRQLRYNSADEKNQAAREAEQFAAMKATQDSWVASESAKIADQAAGEAAKLQQAADDQAVREAEQMAQQQKDLEQLAARGGAPDEVQAQLADLTAEAERKAARAADKDAARAARKEEKRAQRKAEKEARKSSDDVEAQAAAEAADQEQQQSNAEPSASSSNNDSNNDDEEGQQQQSDDAPVDSQPEPTPDPQPVSEPESDPRRPSGGSGPIWGKYSGMGSKNVDGFAYATYHYYAPGYETYSLYCADEFNKFLPINSDHWLLELPWTAYCNDMGLGPMTPDKCGNCLKATNPATGQYVKLRVVDMCGQGGVDIDPLGFNAIDGNGAGVRDGHMNLHLEWC